MANVIYEPKGKAREYSPLALNIYLECTHGCEYCYAPRCMQRKRENYFKKPEPRKNIIENLKSQLEREAPKKQVLLSFIGDPYCETEDNNRATRECLELLLEHRVPVAILTKGGERCLKDLELFKKFGEHIMIGATLTFDNFKDSSKWEPGAASPGERLEVLKKLHQNGIKTFASFEPVVVPAQSLSLMKQGLDAIDVYKVGKLNNYKCLDKEIDWKDFLVKALDLLRGAEKDFYIKHDLRTACAGVKLYGNEVLPDEHSVL